MSGISIVKRSNLTAEREHIQIEFLEPKLEQLQQSITDNQRLETEREYLQYEQIEKIELLHASN